MKINSSFSNLLILISFTVTGLSFIYPNIFLFGINNIFLNEGLYHIYFIQFFTGNFIHGGFIHLIANSLFLFFFGNIVETIIGKNKIILFFIFLSIFNGLLLTYFTNVNTVGISGFCMALISYYTLELRSKNNPEYKGGITAIIVNVGIGFAPGISLLGHLFGAIGGVIFYLLNKNYLRRKYVGLSEES